MPRHTHKLGLVTKLHQDATGQIAAVRALGLDTCHLSVYRPDYLTEANRAIILAEAKDHEVEITAMWAGYPGRVVWDLIEGPTTTGLVPLEVRAERSAIIKRSADIAAAMGIREIITHLGFVPEDLHDERYKSLIPVIQDIAAHLKLNGQVFCFETGQETPVTLLRTIEDVAMTNVGVNFDPANLLLYGKGNPIDALPLLGPHIRSVHAKDGFYPKDGRHLGAEKPVGEGQVDFPRFLDRLAAVGYGGPLCIECDLPEGEREGAVRKGIRLLEGLLPSQTGRR